MGIDFFGVGGPPHIGSIKETVNTGSSKTGEASKSDRVEFSSVLNEVKNSRSSMSAEEAERAARVAALKQQVADGSYKPDIQKVATSLLQFLVESR
ncbi:MAG: flagellar biosynthesis anti-sigma factor FlgM [Proteobacteria bacterium]|nr:MAG: flagellar biosynthesis anti-sigma factor FlgM [Pseudomonadota bacterium]